MLFLHKILKNRVEKANDKNIMGIYTIEKIIKISKVHQANTSIYFKILNPNLRQILGGAIEGRR